ncbi:hypothetical protein ACLKA7_003274 [Drosophila subpalustris]
MTESTQLQTAENNNAGVVKMEPPPLATSTHSSLTHSLVATATAAAVAGAGGTALSPATPPLPHPLGQHSSQQQQQQQHYALKWNDFQTSILSSFRHLRDEEDFIDVTLACDERSFTAHKVVLSACSPYFRKLLKANPCEHPIVILRDVRSDDVENLLSFMYNGEVNVSHEQLPDFLKTAHLLQIRGLADVNGGYPYAKALSAALSHSSSSNNNNNNNNADSSNHNKISNYLPTALSNSNSNNNNNNSSSSNSNNNNNHNNNSNNINSHSQNSPFNTPQTPATLPASSAAAAAAAAAAASLTAAVAAAAAATASSLPLGGSSQAQSQSGSGSGSGSGNGGGNGTPAIQELKASAASPASSSNHWDLSDMEGSRKSHLTPPPQKRIKSADLFRAQHGISPERLLIDRDFPVAGQHPLTRNRSRDTSKDRDRSLELRESLLGQALENSNGQQANQKHDLGQSAGEDSNSSDTEPSDRGDGQHDGTLDGMDNQRSHSFPNAFLGLQGIPGLLPGPSALGANDFGTFLSSQQSSGIKQEILDVPVEEQQPHEAHAADRQPTACKLAKLMQRPQLAQLFERRTHNNNNSSHNNNNNNNNSNNNNNNNNTNNNNNINRTLYKKNRSTNSSPTPSARSWNDSEDEHDYNQDDRSSSASSAISLTMKRCRQASESTLYLTLQQHQQQQHQQQQQQQQQQLQQQQQQQQQQSEHRPRHEQQLNQQQHQQQQQQQYLDELQQSVSVSHQQQLTANLFMARTIALSRSRDFPELFQNTSAAAVAAAAAAAATATATSAIAGAAAAAAPGGGSSTSAGSGSNAGSNYMLPCPLCETPLEQRVFRQHLDRHYPRDSPVCPVIECGRRFAHPNSVRNHMRIKHTLQWAKMKAMRSSGGPFAGGPDFKFKSEAAN